MSTSQDLVDKFKNEQIAYVRLFQVNLPHRIIDHGRSWAVDGGIEIATDGGKVLCVGWDQDIDQFTLRSKSLKEISPELEAQWVRSEDATELDRFISTRIVSINVITASGEDYFGEPIEIPLELRFNFSSGPSLQVALVGWDGIEAGCRDLRYSADEQILVTMGRDHVISHPE